MKKYLHTFDSFIKTAWKEPSTWIGIALLCGWCYHNEIHSLISKILTSKELFSGIITGILSAGATISGVILIAVKGFIIKYIKKLASKK